MKDLGKSSSALYAIVDDTRIWDLTRPLESSGKIDFVPPDAQDPKTIETLWNSGSLILAWALEQKFMGNGLLSHPPGQNYAGFYYDFVLKKGALDQMDTFQKTESNQFGIDDVLSKDKDRVFHLNQEDLKELTTAARKLAKTDVPFERLQVSKEVALDMFSYSPFKLASISKLPSAAPVTLYKCGNFVDLSDGPHVHRTSQVRAIQFLENSASMWDSSNALHEKLNRIQGVSFPKEDALVQWKQKHDEIMQRDHRHIGKEQKLFYMHPMSPGSIFMLPHGTRIVNRLLEFLRKQYRHYGFEEVVTPMLYNKDLWVRSGHWENYKEDMFLINEIMEEQKDETCIQTLELGLKPMNCPGHCLIYSSESHSYRDLPIRYADFSALHRNEASGALTGLTRVRKFHQDDGHIFARMDQIETEIASTLDFMETVYKLLEFDSFKICLSTRPAKYMGDLKDWDLAEESLKNALKKRNLEWTLNEGDGAFYGPKIDILVQDAIGRSHQTATIQLDFQLPVRFDLKYVTEDKSFKRPVIIHRAILGSVERMMAIAMEHFAGKWPLWLSPRQAMVIPVREDINAYATKVARYLSNGGDSLHDSNYFFVDADTSDRTLGKKVREAQGLQYNYLLVVGDKEMADGTVSVRSRDGSQLGQLSLDQTCSLFRNS